MNIILTPVCNFGDNLKDTETKIGYIRADHDGYRWWTTYFPCHEELKTEDIRNEINGVCGELIENMFLNLGAIKEFCHRRTEAKTSEDIYDFYIESELCNYWVRFITRKKDYNMYLHAYIKSNKK